MEDLRSQLFFPRGLFLLAFLNDGESVSAHAVMKKPSYFLRLSNSPLLGVQMPSQKRHLNSISVWFAILFEKVITFAWRIPCKIVILHFTIRSCSHLEDRFSSEIISLRNYLSTKSRDIQ